MTVDVIRVLERVVNKTPATPTPPSTLPPQNNRPACAFLRSQVLSARVARSEFRTPAALIRQPYRQARLNGRPDPCNSPRYHDRSQRPPLVQGCRHLSASREGLLRC